MIVGEFKGKKLANTLSLFNYYKQATGHSVEADLAVLNRREEMLKRKDSMNVEQLQAATDMIDPVQVITSVYYAMRCAAECKRLDFAEETKDLTLEDISSPELSALLGKLASTKKKGHPFLGGHRHR